MVSEQFFGDQEHFWGWRCIFCGEIVDSVILENRRWLRTEVVYGNKETERLPQGRWRARRKGMVSEDEIELEEDLRFRREVLKPLTSIKSPADGVRMRPVANQRQSVVEGWFGFHHPNRY